VRGFASGLLVGVLVGGGAVYLAQVKPWEREAEATVEPDAGPEVAKDTERPRRRTGQRRRGGGTRTVEVTEDAPVLSAADRAMQRRGDAIALPTREVDFEGPAGRPLNAGEINQVIRERSGAILDCITEARGQAQLDATVRLELLVDGDGRVVKSAVRAPRYLMQHGFDRCARRAAQAMRFPATGAHTIVDAPFDLY
jgi:hypothetical protein